ncbi:MAG: diaminopimelate decarboxylase [Gammaproteobacteria bacterium]|nr:diaminopimelate decarboxylase [Gammaproteobacteria bacterium]NND38172.1 diaminopimelate decarboxylase [Pseudomonadales bacterium]MBT8151730.1 diaminopimelate decarboxylase [Gammaproteobacteria bacterium]NNL11733.1 diaminopimelate decarboxylase [Pseudomonadales bacterium]NNM11373.1 diaminopimelate decarboxylase [Pseudomonadales bacterium]
MSSGHSYQHGQLQLEQVPLASIAAQAGTPCYVYSRAALEQNYLAYRNALDLDSGKDHRVCYAVKANSNLAVLNVLAKLGSGFDIVSAGELERVLRAGGDPARVVFSGVAKQAYEIERALAAGIHCFNVESSSEIERIALIAARLDLRARISIRVNPDVNAQTHPYISTGLRENKFGIDIDSALQVYRKAAALDHLDIIGIDCHIGSQLTSTAPFIDALQRVLGLVDKLQAENIHLQHIDIGGGLGVRYKDESPPTPADYMQQVLQLLDGRPQSLVLEPGRSIAANAGLLLTRVDTIKSNQHKRFAIVDAAMNDMLRPALYEAWMEILPLKERNDAPTLNYDIVGPVCETGDWLGKDRKLAISEGDLLALCGAGAYGFVMASNYNSRPRAAEVMVDKKDFYTVRERETFDDLVRGEHLLSAQ